MAKNQRVSVVLLGFAALFGVAACGGAGQQGSPVGEPDAGNVGGGGGGGGGTDGGGTDAGNSSNLVAPSGGLALQVNQARRAVIGTQPSPVEMVVTLANGQGAPPASLNPVLFQVKTSNGLFVTATTGTPRWVDGQICDPTLSVAGASSYRCVLQAVLSGGGTPVELVYRTPNAVAGVGSDQRTTSDLISVEPCVTCGSDCTYTDRDPNNCGACGVAVDPSTQKCVAGAPSCQNAALSICPSSTGSPACVDLKTDWSNCGSCGKAVGTGQECLQGTIQCLNGFSPCGSNACYNLLSDSKNCGACGVAVPLGGTCKQGVPDCGTLTRCGASCVDLRTDSQNCGACGVAVPTGGACTQGAPGCGTSGTLTQCGTTCIDTSMDRQNCGSCGHVCPTTVTYGCLGGVCW